MGRGRVDPAPPAPINTARMQKRRRRKNRKRETEGFFSWRETGEEKGAKTGRG